MYELGHGVRLFFQTPETFSFKFGYYNISPLSADGTKLLAHKVKFQERLPNSKDTVELGYFELSDGSWNRIAESSAFNWQQGSMLQWLGPDFNSRVIFNDADLTKQRYISRIHDLQENSERVIPCAIYGVHPSGDFSISLNFERCSFTRAYGYESIRDETWNVPIPERDGVLKVDLRTGEVTTLIKLLDILRLGDQVPLSTSHWFEHVMLNRSGSRFAFYHRYLTDQGFTTRVFTANPQGGDVWLHPNKPNERVTHLGWIDDVRYVLFTVPQSRLQAKWKGQIGKPTSKWYVNLYRKYFKSFVPRKVVRGLPSPQAYYALVLDQDGVKKDIRINPRNMDGHPSFSRTGRFMLTDTYAGPDGFRNLVLHDLELSKSHLLGRFYSVYNNCSWRTDLHPRFSPDERFVIIDSSHSSTCQILMLELDWSVFL